MSRKRIDKNKSGLDTDLNSSATTDENSNVTNLLTKLDRRRRIEELNEERRARDDLSVF
jgi:hypothetical protein